jgi:hypothetical protein
MLETEAPVILKTSIVLKTEFVILKTVSYEDAILVSKLMVSVATHVHVTSFMKMFYEDVL